jgi:hypothetical protein
LDSDDYKYCIAAKKVEKHLRKASTLGLSRYVELIYPARDLFKPNQGIPLGLLHRTKVEDMPRPKLQQIKTALGLLHRTKVEDMPRPKLQQIKTDTN